MSEKNDKSLLSLMGRLVARNLFLTLVLTFGLGLLLIVGTFDRRELSIPYLLIFETGKTLLISTTIALIAKWYLTKQELDFIGTNKRMMEEEYEQELDSALNRIEEKISDQTVKLTSYASSLDAMQKRDIRRLYENLPKASQDIKADILNRDINTLRIAGISLDEFLHPSTSALHEAWRGIESDIKSNRSGGLPLDIKILLIDPSCNGAYQYHRAKAEDGNSFAATGWLENNVLESLKGLQRLILLAKDKDLVRFEVRLYRNSPILFLVQTDFVSYVQQYHFGGNTNPNLNPPLICYQGKKSSHALGRTLHEEMELHFDYTWKNCSIGIDEYLNYYAQGCDTALRSARIINMYYDSTLWKQRVIRLMDNAKDRLYLKGITLGSFFSDKSGDLFDAFYRVAVRPGIKIRVMIIDPECEQAKIRSFREYLEYYPQASWEEFCNHNIYKGENLFIDANKCIRNISRLLKELKSDGNYQDISFRKFYSAPESFILLTEEAALVEQYHYGKIRNSEQASETINSKPLWGQVPTIEYGASKSLLVSDPLSTNLHHLFENHFEFVYDNFAKEILMH